MKKQSNTKKTTAANALKEKLHDILHGRLNENDILQCNEIEANRLVSTFIFVGSAVLLSVLALCAMHIFGLSADGLFTQVICTFLGIVIPAVIAHFVHYRTKWIKFFLLIELVIVLAYLDCMLGYNVTLNMVFPVILSCRYCSSRFTKLIAGISALTFGISCALGPLFGIGMLDLNFLYKLPAGTVLTIDSTLSNAVRAIGLDPYRLYVTRMNLSYLPRLIVFIIISAICVKIAGKGRSMVLEQKKIVLKNARIESELTLANDIQAHMLPNIFPPFPEQNEFDLYATMHPAKEVGGDFYDFYMVDDKTIAMVIADVSGKGVPAALVMVITKTLIKNEVTAGLSPAAAFNKVNHMLCEGNDDNMFVTAWLGTLNVETGTLTYVNAGHNPPLVRLNNGDFIFLQSRPGLVLAGMDDIHYKQHELQMHPGDRLFLYTDGVTEAVNPAKEMYGNDRLLGYINAHKDAKLADVLNGLTTDIKRFADTEEQFDDMTMLLFDYISAKPGEVKPEKVFPAKIEALDEVTAFVEQELDKACCPPKTVMQITLCVEELFANVANYAYKDSVPGNVCVYLRCFNGEMTLRISDYGIPFDPLEQTDPDVSLSAEERPIGGLGIFIVKKTMDDIHYERRAGMNILTMKKKLY